MNWLVMAIKLVKILNQQRCVNWDCSIQTALAYEQDKQSPIPLFLTSYVLFWKRLNYFFFHEICWLRWRTIDFTTGFGFVIGKMSSEEMMGVTSSFKEGNKMGMDNGKYVRYTPEQVEALERVYHECPKPSSIRRQQLIRECPILSNIEPKQIKVWFQNRRYKFQHFSE